jgi:hypothetical protein
MNNIYSLQINPIIALLNDLNHINKAIEFDNAVTEYLDEKETWSFFDLMLFLGAKSYIGLFQSRTKTQIWIKSFLIL